jgi:glucokinase
VDARIRELKASNPGCLLARLTADVTGGEASRLAAALQQGDADAQRILNETAADLAFGLSHVVHLFHPAVIVLGGGLSKVGEPLREAVEASLSPLLMEAFQPGPPVRLSLLGENAVPTGALFLAGAAR